MKKFLANRKLYQNVAVYLGTAWVILEATNFFIQRYSLPGFIDDVVLTCSCFGLISFIIHSWYERNNDYSGINKREALLHSLNIIIASISVFLIIKNSGSNLVPLKKTLSEENINSIAILPFRNLSNNASYDYFGEGFADDIITRLSQSGDFTVISPISSFKHRESDVDINKIAIELGVSRILQGSYLIQNNEVRINVKLVNTENNEILVARNFDGFLENILKLQVEVASGISNALNIKLFANKYSSENASRTIDINVFKNYQKGRSLLREDYISRDVIGLSKQYFKKAIEQDSMYADAYIGLAESYYLELLFGYTSFKDIAPQVKLYATLAKNIQPEAGEPYAILGMISFYEYKWQDAKNYLEKSISQNPNYPFGYYGLAYYYVVHGDKTKAYEEYNRCITLDPLNTNFQIFKAIGQFYFQDYNQSLAIAKSILSNNPDHEEALFTNGITMAAMGKYQEAVDFFSKRTYGSKTNFALGYTYGMMGKSDKAIEILNYLLKRSEEQYVPPTQIALVYIGIHDYKKALDWLEKAYLGNDGWLLVWTRYGKFYEPVRSDPRYKELLKKMNIF